MRHLEQGPLPTTAGDFWRMVYENRSDIVLMLTQHMEDRSVSKVWLSPALTGL